MAISKVNQESVRDKGSFRRRRLVMIGLACFFSWAAVILWNQVGKLEERGSKVSALEQKLEEANQTNANLKWEITRLNDPEYLEQIIQRDLNYVKEDQIIFHQTKPQKK